MLAARLSELARPAGTERRQRVAHGDSRGYRVANDASPIGAKDFPKISSTFVRPIERAFSVAPPGLDWSYSADPRLTPWATILRHSVAYK